MSKLRVLSLAIILAVVFVLSPLTVSTVLARQSLSADDVPTLSLCADGGTYPDYWQTPVACWHDSVTVTDYRITAACFIKSLPSNSDDTLYQAFSINYDGISYTDGNGTDYRGTYYTNTVNGKNGQSAPGPYKLLNTTETPGGCFSSILPPL
jgi:hypothetical protein